MSEPLPETYLLSIPGTEETEELSRPVMLERMARGEITDAHWVWSPGDQDWKQVGDIPSLHPTLPAMPSPGAPGEHPPAAERRSFFGFGRKKKTEPTPTTNSIITPITATPPTPVKHKKIRRRRAKEKTVSHFPIFSFLGGILVLAVVGLVAVNYEFVDKPFDGELAQTPFLLVQAHAHLGGFIQPDKIIIHVLPNHELHSANFADFLFALAKSTPPPPLASKPFTLVELTSGWRGQYAFEAADWQQFAQMDQSSAQERMNFVLDHVYDTTGELLAPPDHGAPDASRVARDRVWQDLLGDFGAGS